MMKVGNNEKSPKCGENDMQVLEPDWMHPTLLALLIHMDTNISLRCFNVNNNKRNNKHAIHVTGKRAKLSL